jgi:UDP-2-acetamido-3-amino-2,3-dideoxy-glucuronate N-acetyltransferase
MSTYVHPTAIVEPDVTLGRGTRVWDNAHIRGPTRLGSDCIVGEKTHIAYGVGIGDRVKINAFVYVCTAVTIEEGVMIGAGTVFTNERFPRATTTDLTALRPSEPTERTLPTLVRAGATIGAGSVIGNDLVVGRWSMVGMGSVVTRSIPDFHLAVGSPARSVGCVCRCGEPFVRFDTATPPDSDGVTCSVCGLRYAVHEAVVTELDRSSGPAIVRGATERVP